MDWCDACSLKSRRKKNQRRITINKKHVKTKKTQGNNRYDRKFSGFFERLAYSCRISPIDGLAVGQVVDRHPLWMVGLLEMAPTRFDR